jgi:hypothetical protein
MPCSTCCSTRRRAARREKTDARRIASDEAAVGLLNEVDVYARAEVPCSETAPADGAAEAVDPAPATQNGRARAAAARRAPSPRPRSS